MALGVIFATMALQVLNFKVFHKDGRNSTRFTLIAKEIVFVGHAIMLIAVTEVIYRNYNLWFANMFGMFFFLGCLCWFLVFLRGLYDNHAPQ